MGGWFQTWLNVLTHPGEPVFEAERQRPEATLSTALIWMAIAAVINGIVALISAYIFRNTIRAAGGWQGMLGQLGLPDEIMSQIDPSVVNAVVQTQTTGTILSAAFWSVLWTLGGFLIGVGILYLIARVLGGTGAYGRYAYLIASFGAPLSIVSSIIGFVPVVGGCIGLLLSIYGMVLTYFATKVEHGLTQGKAIATVLIPLAFLILIFICATTVLVGAIAAIMGSQ
jgi:hypothetical protein